MLNSVSNINPNSDYKNSNQPEKTLKKIGKFYKSRISGNDGASLSPAVSFLHDLKWKLLEFKNVTKDKLIIRFLIEDIEFSTSVDLPDVYRLSNVSYKLNRIDRNSLSESLIFPEFVTVLPLDYEASAEPAVQIRGLVLFFDDLVDFEPHNSLPDCIEYAHELFEQYKNLIEKDFVYINGNLKIFLERFLEIKIIPQVNTDEERLSIKITSASGQSEL